jgi:arylformamidase
VRAIGIDTISLTAFQNRPLGRQAHLAFLAPEENTNPTGLKNNIPILIIEDMKLSGLKKTPQEVWVSPLLIHGADGVPVTVTAW